MEETKEYFLIPQREYHEDFADYAKRVSGYLERAKLHWQNKLKLSEWKIIVRVATPEELYRKEDRPLDGYCDSDRYHFTSTIDVSCASPDPTYTLVHEIIHILLTEFLAAAEQAADMVESSAARNALKGNLVYELERLANRLTIILIGRHHLE